jgi:hypothetical protein
MSAPSLKYHKFYVFFLTHTNPIALRRMAIVDIAMAVGIPAVGFPTAGNPSAA